MTPDKQTNNTDINRNEDKNFQTTNNISDNITNRHFLTVAITLFMCVLILPTVSWYGLKFLGKYNKNINKLTESTLKENRELAKLENLTVGNITAKLEDYYNDHVPFRTKIMTLNNKINSTLEKPYDQKILRLLSDTFYSDRRVILPNNDHNGSLDNLFANATEPENKNFKSCNHEYIITASNEASYSSDGCNIYKCQKCGDIYYADHEDKKIDSSYFPEIVYNGTTVKGRNNWLFYNWDNSIEYYRDVIPMSDDEMEAAASRIEYLNNLCASKGKTFRIMIMPNKEQVYWEYMPTYKISGVNKRVEKFCDYLKEHKNIEMIYPLDELKNAKQNWQVYYSSDTHWNSAGAFIGTQALYKSLGLPVTNLCKLDTQKVSCDSGDLVSLGNLNTSNYNDATYAIPYRNDVKILSEEGDKYMSGSFFSTSNSPNKCNFVLLSDSFRIAMIPFLQKDFSNVITTHREHIYDPEIVEAIKNSDVLVLAAVERFDTSLYEAVEQTIDILENY